ncbi:phenylalanine--tRNA ligase subunit alpha [Gammaproteobacteria bacterium]|nr:phenylalanine--tRNA ligase subunit alpha [Gammaproteobacteria bacterium]
MMDLDQILNEAIESIKSAKDLKILDECRVHYLGKKGKLTETLKSLGKLSSVERPIVGQKVNRIKEKIQLSLNEKISFLEVQKINSQIDLEKIDVTLPGRKQSVGSLHPISQTKDAIEDLFNKMGFVVKDGPEVETDYYNFEALNIPTLHPARAMQDTFYFSDNTLLRSQMSPVQIHVMEKTPPPLRVIAMGRVYRRDFDLTHTPMFHQIEGLMIDKNVSFADLKGILTYFLQEFFEKSVPIRFRPSYFPFTEPSAEVDIGCLGCDSKGCRICKNTGWLEVLGCGMVHPNVFKSVGVDSESYTGWAFGCGLDRLALLRYGLTDLRAMFENDIRFLRQF